MSKHFVLTLRVDREHWRAIDSRDNLVEKASELEHERNVLREGNSLDSHLVSMDQLPVP